MCYIKICYTIVLTQIWFPWGLLTLVNCGKSQNLPSIFSPLMFMRKFNHFWRFSWRFSSWESLSLPPVSAGLKSCKTSAHGLGALFWTGVLGWGHCGCSMSPLYVPLGHNVLLDDSDPHLECHVVFNRMASLLGPVESVALAVQAVAHPPSFIHSWFKLATSFAQHESMCTPLW